jgi:tetratricopeptide (TPR) repeat protein
MTPREDFERFAERLDRDWTRERLRAIAREPGQLSEAELLRAVERADPLAERAESGWWEALRLLLAPWPARLTLGAAVAALVLVGFALGRVVDRDTESRLVRAIPPMPAYAPERQRALGVAPATNRRAREKLEEAMRFREAPDFAVKALPLLREAVAVDASNDAAQFWLGVALLQVDRPQEAVAPLEHAVRLAPASALYKHYLLFAYLRTGSIRLAMSVLSDLMRPPR